MNTSKLNVLQGNKGDMLKSTRHDSFSMLGCLRPFGNFFKKKKNQETVFRFGLGECVYQISGMNLFMFGQRV